MKHMHDRSHRLPFHWPEPPLNVVLVEPEIPPNTGNIARLCAATGTPLHLVGPLGFSLASSHLRRAGLDYWESVKLVRHASWQAFEESEGRGQESEVGLKESEAWGGRLPAVALAKAGDSGEPNAKEVGGRSWFFSTRGRRSYTEVRYQPGDRLIFGCESKGLSDDLLARHEDHILAIPMQTEHVRSLNLATTVGIILYEALRQCQLSAR